MSNINPDLIVVIRTVGERTFETCHNLVIQQIPEKLVHIVSEQPFEATLRRCYEIGIESNAKWMMTLDADVLLKEDAIKDFLSEAEAFPENYFQVEGLVHDKLSGLYRKAGHRMYRTKYLKQALQEIPASRAEIRPEYTTLQRMTSLGYLSGEIDRVFGIHDYEQFFSDVYRKAFIHANKHQSWIPQFIERWKQKATEDDDFRVALRGLYDGLMFTGQAAIDVRDFISLSKKALLQLELSEKSQLYPDAANLNLVVSTLDHIESISNKTVTIQKTTIPQPTRYQRLSAKYHQLKTIKLIIYLIGFIFSKIGYWLKKYASLTSSTKCQ